MMTTIFVIAAIRLFQFYFHCMRGVCVRMAASVFICLCVFDILIFYYLFPLLGLLFHRLMAATS